MLRFNKAGNSAYQDVHGIYSHIVDPNERRRLVLAEIDKAPLSWHHLRMVVVTGLGFWTDSYSLFAISLATTLLGMVYWQENNKGVIPHNAETAIKVATSAGTVIGQVVFGYLADLLGRKRMYGIELLIIISGTLAQCLCAPSPAISLVGVLVFWRSIMGIGVGGDYPLSAVITSEMADTRWRGLLISAVFSMQGLGQFSAAMVALVLTFAYKDTLLQASDLGDCKGSCSESVDMMWRILLGFGAIPGWFALYYRLSIPETPRYTFDVKQDLEKAAADARRFQSGFLGEGRTDKIQRARTNVDTRKYHRPLPTLAEFCRYFKKWRNFKILVGTAGSWFFLDVAFYGLGLNTPTILSTIGFSHRGNCFELLKNMATGQLVLTLAGSIPGYSLTILFVDSIGRKPIQIGGFLILTILFAIIGFCFDHLSQRSLLVLYVLCQLFFNFGPNATTFMVPGECFPTRLRATAHGVSAAAGKIGAVIAQLVIAPLVSQGATAQNPHPWLNRVMQIFSLFMLCGLFTSLLIPETKRRTLEELAGENDETLAYELRFVSAFFRTSSTAISRRRTWSSWIGNSSRNYFRFSGSS